MTAPIRPYETDDLGGLLELWEQAGWLPVGHDGLAVDQAVELLHSHQAVVLVAEASNKVVASVVGVVAGRLAWVYRLALHRDQRGDEGMAQALLEQLEGRLAERGARTLLAVVRDGTEAHADFERRSYRRVEGMLFLERTLPAATMAPAALAELGGRMIPPELWKQLRGMEEAKEIIERRVILPLEHPDLADRHAVVPPRAIVLFGPPGTGKTTFAKGIASQLGWPFVEIQPAEIAGEGPAREAKLLAEVFARVAELPSAVAFVDEVEDLASMRHEQRKVSPGVTNEFLKQIPRLRDQPRHLLVCATNAVGTLDPAFLRPGRFDYVLPVGPPGAPARREIWSRYIEEITDEAVDFDALVAASELFTPADIEFAARKAAQRAFEREHFAGEGPRASTEDFLAAIAETKPTLSEQMVRNFNEDTDRFARF